MLTFVLITHKELAYEAKAYPVEAELLGLGN